MINKCLVNVNSTVVIKINGRNYLMAGPCSSNCLVVRALNIKATMYKIDCTKYFFVLFLEAEFGEQANKAGPNQLLSY